MKKFLLDYLATQSLKACILTDSHTPSPDAAQNALADVVANEVGWTGYSRQTLAGVTVTQDDTDNEGVLDCNDLVFASVSGAGNGRYLLVFADTPTTPEADPVVSDFDFGENKLAQGGDLTVPIPAEGLLNLG